MYITYSNICIMIAHREILIDLTQGQKTTFATRRFIINGNQNLWVMEVVTSYFCSLMMLVYMLSMPIKTKDMLIMYTRDRLNINTYNGFEVFKG